MAINLEIAPTKFFMRVGHRQDPAGFCAFRIVGLRLHGPFEDSYDLLWPLSRGSHSSNASCRHICGSASPSSNAFSK